MEKQNEKMSLKEKILLGVSILAASAGITCLGYSIHRERKFERLLAGGLKRIDEMTEVTIADGIVRKAVENAAEREAGKASARAVEAISEGITEDVARRVKGAVEQRLGQIQKTVGEQVAKEVAKINKDEIMNEVIERAKQEATNQFNAKLDAILENQNQNLESISRIYKGIADKMAGTKTESKGIELKLA